MHLSNPARMQTRHVSLWPDQTFPGTGSENSRLVVAQAVVVPKNVAMQNRPLGIMIGDGRNGNLKCLAGKTSGKQLM